MKLTDRQFRTAIGVACKASPRFIAPGNRQQSSVRHDRRGVQLNAPTPVMNGNGRFTDQPTIEPDSLLGDPNLQSDLALQRRPTLVPVGALLIGVAYLEQHGLIKGASRKLHSHRQSPGSEAAGHRHGG